MVNKNDIVYAIHEDDLTELLMERGLIEDLKSGKIKCIVCKKIINVDNFGAISFKKQKAYLICDSPRCITIWGEGG